MRLLHQVRRVLGEDPVAQTELADLLDHLGIGAVQPDVGRQRSSLAGGPEPWDELVVGRAPRHVDAIAESLGPPRPSAFQHQLAGAVSTVTPEQQKFFSVKQVGERVGVHVFQLCRRPHDTQVRERRVGDLSRQRRDRLFDIVAGSHIAHGAAAVLSHPLEQIRVDIVAHTEGEDSFTVTQSLHRRRDPFGRRLADGRLAIGQEHDEGKAARLYLRRQRLAQRVHDVGAPFGAKAGQILSGLAQRSSVRWRPAATERTHDAAERDQAEAVPGTQTGQDLVEGRAGLLHLFTRHRAGDVEYQRDVARDLRLAGLGRRRDQQHEVAGLAPGRVRQQAGADLRFAQRQKELEVAGGATATVDDLQLIAPALPHLDGVGR